MPWAYVRKNFIIKERGFLLLEMSCSMVLLLLILIPYLFFQRDSLYFIKREKEQVQRELTLQNARVSLLAFQEKEGVETILYYQKEKGWQLQEEKIFFQAKIQYFTLCQNGKKRKIRYFQIYDFSKQKVVWEGWRLAT